MTLLIALACVVAIFATVAITTWLDRRAARRAPHESDEAGA